MHLVLQLASGVIQTVVSVLLMCMFGYVRYGCYCIIVGVLELWVYHEVNTRLMMDMDMV
jgi:hypothetical protein